MIDYRTDYVPVPIAARLLGLREPQVRTLITAGLLPTVVTGRSRPTLHVTDLAAFRGRPVTPTDLAEARERHKSRLSTYAKINARRKATTHV
jgi:hypothetical protein